MFWTKLFTDGRRCPWVILLWLVAQAGAQAPEPHNHLAKIMANSHLQVEGQVTGEQFSWHAAWGADDFVDAYLAWGDEAWLEQGGRYFDWLVGLMALAPDGYRGWIGPYIYDGQYWCDVHVGDAILINPMLRFAEVVLTDSALSAGHGARARRYVELARRELIEKWDRRGTWQKDGSQGYYRSWDRYLAPGDLSAWRPLAERRAGLSLPFNKQMDMGLAALRLYRITGESFYRQRAEAVFGLFKARLNLMAGGYVWNYWEPLDQRDIDLEEGRIRHWVNVHPKRNYQAREVAFVVEAYHSGVVFDQVDIERIIQTNLGHMWNGDLAVPRWRNAGVVGAWVAPAKGGAGTLWSALVDFDQRARRLYERGLQPGSIDGAYYQQVRALKPPTFTRRYSAAAPQGVKLALRAAPNLTMAAVLPRESRRGAAALVVCKAASAGPLRVELYRRDGEFLDTLYSGQIRGGSDGLEGLLWISWETGAQPPGAYTVRWTLGEEYREYPVLLR